MQTATAVTPHPGIFTNPFPAVKLPVYTAPRKRKIVVFDPEKRSHQSLLMGLVKGIVDVVWFDKFSDASLERGELAEGVDNKDLDVFNPAALIVELELLPPKWRSGVKLIENYRRNQGFNSGTKLIIISNVHSIMQVLEDDFERLALFRAFAWNSLHSIHDSRHFISAIREAAR